jgi:hypothetical protein
MATRSKLQRLRPPIPATSHSSELSPQNQMHCFKSVDPKMDQHAGAYDSPSETFDPIEGLDQPESEGVPIHQPKTLEPTLTEHYTETSEDSLQEERIIEPESSGTKEAMTTMPFLRTKIPGLSQKSLMKVLKDDSLSMAELPNVVGPKFGRFRPLPDPLDIIFQEEIKQGEHSHIWKVICRGYTYALKLVSPHPPSVLEFPI